MTEKEKTVEVTLAKKHTHRGVQYSKGDVIEVAVSDVPLLEDFKVLEEGSARPAGTKQRLLDEEAAKKKAEFDARIASFETKAEPVAAKAAPKIDTPANAAGSTKENG